MTWACSGSPKGWPPTLLRNVAHQGWLKERRWLRRDGYADSEPECKKGLPAEVCELSLRRWENGLAVAFVIW